MLLLLSGYILFTKLTFSTKSSFSAKQFESRSGPIFCRSWSRSNLFVKVISRWQMSTLGRKDFNLHALLSSGLNIQLLQFFYSSLSGHTAQICRLILPSHWSHMRSVPNLITCWLKYKIKFSPGCTYLQKSAIIQRKKNPSNLYKTKFQLVCKM